jgi:hypothetical protein
MPHCLAPIALKQVRGEIASCDLARRPPERLRGNLAGARSARESVLQEAVAAAGHQLPAEYGPEAGGLYLRTGSRGDRLGDRVSLLAGEAALLDRKGGGIPYRVHVGRAWHTAVGVDGNEASDIGRDSGCSGSVESRQADDAVGFDTPLPPIEQHSAVAHIGMC